MNIVNHPSTHSISRNGASVVAIVLHGTGGVNSLQYFTHNERGVSIHYLIAKDGIVYAMVPETRGANHAGAPSARLVLNGRTWTAGEINKVTIGIELENRQDGKDPYPDLQLHAMAELVGKIRQKWGPLPLVRHATIDPTRRSDPRGLSVEAMERLVVQVAAEDAPPAVVCEWVVLQNSTWVRERASVDSGHKATLTKGSRVRGKEVPGVLHRYSAVWVELEHGGGYVWRPLLAPRA